MGSAMCRSSGLELRGVERLRGELLKLWHSATVTFRPAAAPDPGPTGSTSDPTGEAAAPAGSGPAWRLALTLTRVNSRRRANLNGRVNVHVGHLRTRTAPTEIPS